MGKSQNQFDLLFQNVVIGIYRTTPDGRILLANPALVKMLGYDSFEELYNRNLEDTGFEPEYPRSYFKRLMEEKGEVHGLEYIWTKKDGSILFVRENARAIKNNNGDVLYYEGTVEDISDRKIQEEQLRRSEENFRNLFQLSSDAIIIQDRNRKIIDMNQSAEKLFGYSKEEVISDPDIKLADHDKTNRKLASIYIGKAFKGEPQRFEWWGKKKDGTSFPEEVLLNKTIYEGEEVIFMTIRDITERKKTESALRFQLDFEKTISGISARFINLPVEQISKGIENSILEILQFTEMECGYVFIFSEDESIIQETIGVCQIDIKQQIKALEEKSTSELPWLMEQMSANRNIITTKVNDFPGDAINEINFFKSLGVKVVSFLPLIMGNNLLGFLGLGTSKEAGIVKQIDSSAITVIGQILSHAIERKRADLAREKLINDLKAALTEVKQLSGLLPICAGCKKIRDDKGYWHQVEAYISTHTDVEFSHGLCPDCLKKYYPHEYDLMNSEEKSDSV